MEKKDRKPRYNEKELIKTFLCSKEGIQFINKGIERKRNLGEIDVEREIENLIDFIAAWSHKFPVRRSSRMTKYEFIKFIEDYCDRNGMYLMFGFMYE